MDDTGFYQLLFLYVKPLGFTYRFFIFLFLGVEFLVSLHTDSRFSYFCVLLCFLRRVILPVIMKTAAARTPISTSGG